MRTDRLGGPPDHGRGPAARALGRADRFRAWVVTGPLGRGLAFAVDLVDALWKALRGRDR
jgi:hypothetical protein